MIEIIDQGKTKDIERLRTPFEPRQVRMHNKDDTTAADGARREKIDGKAAITTRTTANFFTLLKACGFNVAYLNQDGPTTITAYELTMIKLEVVTRGLAWGSHLERHQKAKQGDPFDPPRVDFFLKTKGLTWQGKNRNYALLCDDPYMEIGDRDVYLYHAHEPYVRGTYFLRLSLDEAFPIPGTRELLPVIAETNRAVYETLNYAFGLLGELLGVVITFPDMKAEYGFDSLGQLWMGDDLNAESCRLYINGEHASKQGFRENAPAELARLQLARAADLTDHFAEVTDEVRAWVNERYLFCSSGKFPASRI
ncbi:MAG: phosphoribosylaminoimidazolesuccinocarboxamide synthase [Patescibacteria group bacterium]